MKISSKKYPIIKAIEENIDFRDFFAIYNTLRGVDVSKKAESVFDRLGITEIHCKYDDNLSFNYCCSSFWADACNNAQKLFQNFTIKKGTRIFFHPNGFVSAVIIKKGGKLIDANTLVWVINFDGKDIVSFECIENSKYIEKYSIIDLPFFERRATTFTGPLALVFFMDYAPIVSKKLPPKKKIKNYHCRYKNDSTFEVNLLDINWYTESIQGHPFVVRKHLAWRRCGKGKQERKLTWVKEHFRSRYQKGAYKEA